MVELWWSDAVIASPSHKETEESIITDEQRQGLEEMDKHQYNTKSFKRILNDLVDTVQERNLIHQIYKNVENVIQYATNLDKAMRTANEALIRNGEDVSDFNKHTYLLESMIYHMARLINDEKRHSKEEKAIEGMNKDVCIYDDLYNSVQNNLELGQEIKNYKELCRILNQETLGGKQKQLQILDFQRYFEFQKVGHKFVITDIFTEPIPKEDKRKMGNNSIYVKYIEVILLHFLSKQKNYTCVLKKNQIWLLLGMVSKKYNNIPMEDLEKLDYSINSFMVNHFYQRCNQRLERILFTALNNLKNRKLLSYQEQIIIVPVKGVGFIASDDDIRRLDAVAHSVLESMGLISMIQVYCKFKSREFYDEVNDRLRELYGWKYSFKQYKLIYTPENIIKAIPESEVELQRLTLNDSIIETINDGASKLLEKNENKWNKAYEKAQKEYLAFGIGNPRISNSEVVDENGQKVFHYPPYYMEAQRLLAEELLRIGNKKPVDTPTTAEKLDEELDELFACMKI